MDFCDYLALVFGNYLHGIIAINFIVNGKVNALNKLRSVRSCIHFGGRNVGSFYLLAIDIELIALFYYINGIGLG